MGIPVIVDTFNLYGIVRNKYQKVILYDKLFETIKQEHGEDLDISCYISRQSRSNGFVKLMTEKGCFVTQKEIKGRYDSFDVEVTIHLLTECQPVMVLCSNSANLIPTLKKCHDVRMTVNVYCINPPKEFNDYAIVHNIPMECMMDKPEWGAQQSNDTDPRDIDPRSNS